jgi:hypothetical protein
MGKMLDLRHISIIDAMPVYQAYKKVLTVGAGTGELEYNLWKMGYEVTASDIERKVIWEDEKDLRFTKYNILQYRKMTFPVVICSQVLEHLSDYQAAFKNLVKHAEIRLIVTFPYMYAFDSPDHVNHWNDSSVKIFQELAMPYSVAVSKIRTKPEDKEDGKWAFLLIVDKRQEYA